MRIKQLVNHTVACRTGKRRKLRCDDRHGEMAFTRSIVACVTGVAIAVIDDLQQLGPQAFRQRLSD